MAGETPATLLIMLPALSHNFTLPPLSLHLSISLCPSITLSLSPNLCLSLSLVEFVVVFNCLFTRGRH